MGLLDFTANIGKKLFSSEVKPEAAAAKIKAEIDSAKLGITGLDVSMSGQECSLFGECSDRATYQKAILIAGNIKGVADIQTRGLTVKAAAVAEPEVEVEYYIIQDGDNLTKIAKKFYGNANKYLEILAANKEVIKDADLIFPGQKIRIPELKSKA